MLVAEVQREVDLQGKLRHRDAAQPIRSQPGPSSDPTKSNAPLLEGPSSSHDPTQERPAQENVDQGDGGQVGLLVSPRLVGRQKIESGSGHEEGVRHEGTEPIETACRKLPHAKSIADQEQQDQETNDEHGVPSVLCCVNDARLRWARTASSSA